MADIIYRVPPLHYVHVLDLNTNHTRLEVGPTTLALARHETLTFGPSQFVILPPGHYCTISNPVIPAEDLSGRKYDLKIGHKEIRHNRPPFPLYPGEELEKPGGRAVNPMEVIPNGSAINLLTLNDLTDEEGQKRIAGEEYQLLGPLTYLPRVDVQRTGIVRQIVLAENGALKIRARRKLTDRHGNERNVGEVWLMRKSGPYIPTVYEEVVETIKPYVLTENDGLHVRSLVSHVDVFGHERKRGEEWLITSAMAETFIPDVFEEVFKTVKRISLGPNQFCFVLDVVDAQGKNQFGKKELREGVASFFLNPGETLEKGVQKAYILEANEAVLIKALVKFHDKSEGKDRISGELWMISGPTRYVPTIEVEVVETRKAIALDEQEGIYIRNIRTGSVSVVMGPCCYMLGVEEVLYEKELSPTVELLLKKGGGDGDEDIRKISYFTAFADPELQKGPRNKTRVVKYKVPPGTAVQINDHVSKTSRFVFGPEMATLLPHEDFMVFSLSAGKPKRANALKTLVLMLGPDFITDIIKVETSDHAVLNIVISYNNEFIVDKTDIESIRKIFSVPDFIGYTCSIVGARIREHVAQVTFDQFHRNSNTIIEEAAFHRDQNGMILKTLILTANNMLVSNIDVLSIEPADPQVSASLIKSVQMAIEIATKSIETTAKHEASHEKQTALGKLELQKLADAAAVEQSKRDLLESVAQNAAIETTGAAIAEAKARAERQIIEGEAAVRAASLEAQAREIEDLANLHILTAKRNAELEYLREMNELEIKKARELADIEVAKLKGFIDAITRQAIIALSQSGPANQVKLLSALGIKSTLITDGKSPINLFNTARGMITAPAGPSGSN